MFSVVYGDNIAVASAFDSIPEGWTLLDCRALIDGSGNSPQLLDQIVEEAIKKISNSQRLCFACDYGQSRSNLLAALTISKIMPCSIPDAINTVERSHRDSAIKPGLLQGLFASIAPQDGAHIAITGGSGLIGKSLAESLRQSGKTVTTFSRTLHGDYLRSASVLTELLKENNITDLVHLAHPKPYNSYTTTAESFGHLTSITQSCTATSSRLHYMSGWVVFDGTADHVVTEKTPPYAHSLYAQSKVVQEAFLRMHSRNQGLRSRIYRLPGIYSLDSLEPRFLRYFSDCIRCKRDIIYHRFENGSAVVPLCGVSEIADLLHAAINLPPGAPDIIHLSCASTSCSIQEIAEDISAKYGLKALPTPVDRKVFNGFFSTDYPHLLGLASDKVRSTKQHILGFLDKLILGI